MQQVNISICPICNNNTDGDFEFLEYIQNGSMNYPLIMDNSIIQICNKCSFGFCNPNIDEEILNDYYSNYYNGKYLSPKNLSNKIDKKIFFTDPRSLAQINLLNCYINFDNLNILDIGSGNCMLYFQLKTLGYKNFKYDIIEPQVKEHNIYNKLNIKVLSNDIHNRVYENNLAKYNLIVMSHALEHCNSNKIDSIFKNIKSLMNDSSLLFIEVPNADLTKYKYSVENMQPHLSFFSKKTFYALCDKFGFEIIYINKFGNSQIDKILPPDDNSFSISENGRYKLAIIKSSKFKNIKLYIKKYLLGLNNYFSFFLNKKINLNNREGNLNPLDGEFLRVLIKKKYD